MSLKYQQLFNQAEDGRQRPPEAMPTPTPITQGEKNLSEGKNYTPAATATPPAAPVQTAAPAAAPAKKNMWAGIAEKTQNAINPQAGGTPGSEQDVINFLTEQRDTEKAKMETPEQKAKRERREKWSAAISGIGDAASSLANLYFTTQYAPNMYSGQNTLSGAFKERMDKAKAERDKIRDNYINYALKLGDLKDNEREWAFKQEQAEAKKAQQEHDNKIADAKEQRDAALHDLNIKLMNNKINKADADAAKAKVEADYAEQVQQANLAKTRAQTRASNASAAHSRAATNKIIREGRTNGNGGRKVFGTGASVKMTNWKNDDYVEQLYNQMKNNATYKGTDGRTHTYSRGTKDLFDKTGEKIEDAGDRKSKVQHMRKAIEEFLYNNYDPQAQQALGAVIEDFDERY